MTMQNIYSRTIEAELAARRKSKNDLAKYIGISRSSLQRRFSGKKVWNLTEIDAAAKFIGLSSYQLNDLAYKRLRETNE